MRSSIFALFIVGLCTLSSCQKEASVSSDTALIQAIQEATDKQTVNSEALPTASKGTLTQDYTEYYMQNAQMAPELGYEVAVRLETGITQIGKLSNIYFDLEGKKLTANKKSKDWWDKEGWEDKEEYDGKDKEDCFKLVFPATFVMPDGTEIGGEEAETVYGEVKDWYNNNKDSKDYPTLIYPVEIEFDETNRETVNNDEEMIQWKKTCK